MFRQIGVLDFIFRRQGQNQSSEIQIQVLREELDTEQES